MAEQQPEWMSAAAAIALLEPVMGPMTARTTICTRANDKMIRARAARFVAGERIGNDIDVPPHFWQARGGQALKQNWVSGDFETWLEAVHVRAYGVRFARTDIEKLVAEVPAKAPRATRTAVRSNRVFIVHGHAGGPREAVARFLERFKLQPVILHEQPNQGRTLIEKFEANADVGFAIVLLTPDDVGGAVGQEQQQQRARQNVILELGYFIGRLGRARVCALKVGAVELPSDILGVVWTPFDETEAWKLLLGRELRNAGYEVDLNQLA